MSSGGASKPEVKPKSGGASKPAVKPDVGNAAEFVEAGLAGQIKNFKSLWALYLSDPTDCSRSTAYTALRKLLKEHPFVRSETTTVDSVGHAFNAIGFTIDLRGFRTWLKTADGKPYKNIKGTGVDDTVYLFSAFLRQFLPRGLHIVTATNKETGAETVFAFRGIPKFSGLVKTDEDEESDAPGSGAFLFGSMADVKKVYVTEKSNGENAKLGMIRLDGVLYLMAGSKTTFTIWPAEADYFDSYPLKEGERSEGNYPSTTIGKIYSEWFRGLTVEQMNEFEAEFAKHGYNATIIAEINRKWEQHIVPIDMTHLAFVSFLGPDGKSIDPKKAFEFFRRVGVTDSSTDTVRHVSVREVEVTGPDCLDLIEAKIRDGVNSEGGVLYLFGNDDLVGDDLVGLVKVKTAWYVIRRGLRELFRGFLKTLMHGECKGIGHIKTKRNPKSDPKTLKTQQTKEFSKLVSVVMKTAKDRFGGLGEAFVTFMLKRLASTVEVDYAGLVKYVAEQPMSTGTEMTLLMEAVKKLTGEFNANFPQLMAECTAQNTA